MRLLPFFLKLSAITIFRTVSKTGLMVFVPAYFTAKGHSLWTGGAALSVLQLSGALGTLIAGPISDRIGRKLALLVVCIISPVTLWFFTNATGWTAFALLTVLGTTLFAINPVMLAVVNEVETARPAFVNGVYMTINFVVSAAGAFITGIFGDWIGLEHTFQLAALLSLAAVPFVLWLPDPKSLKILF